MSADSIQQEFKSAFKQFGKAGLNALFPNDFEYYMIAFEIVNSKGESVDYFTFPILPNTIKETQPQLNNIRKTSGGVLVMDNETFVPTEIALSGSFGRKFKFLVKSTDLAIAGFRFNGDGASFEMENSEFSSFAKTGYGCIKVMESIKNKSRKLDQYGKPYRLILYNPILGNNYYVKFESFSHSQSSQDSNMMPNYEMRLKSIGPLSKSSGDGQIEDLLLNLGQSAVQNAINRSFSRIKRARK